MQSIISFSLEFNKANWEERKSPRLLMNEQKSKVGFMLPNNQTVYI